MQLQPCTVNICPLLQPLPLWPGQSPGAVSLPSEVTLAGGSGEDPALATRYLGSLWIHRTLMWDPSRAKGAELGRQNPRTGDPQHPTAARVCLVPVLQGQQEGRRVQGILSPPQGDPVPSGPKVGARSCGRWQQAGCVLHGCARGTSGSQRQSSATHGQRWPQQL